MNNKHTPHVNSSLAEKPEGNYCPDLFNYHRRMTHEVAVGTLKMGFPHSVCIQSMTNTSTLDTEASVSQAARIFDAGAQLVRLTAQGIAEAENLQEIRLRLIQQGYRQPLSADIHFNPKVAEVAAQYVEKVRINPGNFVDVPHSSKQIEYDDGQYAGELKKIRERLLPLLAICRRYGVALRIGVNHGSLSNRIMSRYGDTPAGMVESCMEFLRICRDEAFHNVVISLKASNTVLMVHAVRLLTATLLKEGMSYPLHLGVTEAGDAEDGRIKSAVGIGALLADGIGDTIRVSLSEEPEYEIPAAKKLLMQTVGCACSPPIKALPFPTFDPYSYRRRQTTRIGSLGGNQVPVVMGSKGVYDNAPDIYDSEIALFEAQQLDAALISPAPVKYVRLSYPDLNKTVIEKLKNAENVVIIVSSHHANWTGEMRAFFHALLLHECAVPVILHIHSAEPDAEAFMISAAARLGTLLIDGFGDGIWLENSSLQATEVIATAFSILQAARVRTTKTEYISCPGCGRTLFNLQSAIAKVKAATRHLTGLKIAVMGCIVNGPGEMADADFGYVGAGTGKITLYKGKTCIEKNIPEEEAVEKLLALIERSYE